MAHAGGRPKKNLQQSTLPEQNYFTVREVAEMTNSHINTVRARLNDGTLKGKKLGNTWRIYPDSLRECAQKL